MIDLISRQDAIDALKEAFNASLIGTKVAVNAIELVPSLSGAYGEKLDEISNAYENGYQQGKFEAGQGIVRCKDCKHFGEAFVHDGIVHHYYHLIWNLPPASLFDALRIEHDFCSRAERRTDETD